MPRARAAVGSSGVGAPGALPTAGASTEPLEYSELRQAAWEGKFNAEEVERLLRAGGDVEATNDHGDTRFHLCAERGDAEVVARLLEANANVEAVNKHGNTALLLSAFNGHVEVMRLLLRAGAHLNAACDTLSSTGSHAAAARLRGTALPPPMPRPMPGHARPTQERGREH